MKCYYYYYYYYYNYYYYSIYNITCVKWAKTFASKIMIGFRFICDCFRKWHELLY